MSAHLVQADTCITNTYLEDILVITRSKLLEQRDVVGEATDGIPSKRRYLAESVWPVQSILVCG